MAANVVLDILGMPIVASQCVSWAAPPSHETVPKTASKLTDHLYPSDVSVLSEVRSENTVLHLLQVRLNLEANPARVSDAKEHVPPHLALCCVIS